MSTDNNLLKVAIQGQLASFHYEVAKKYFGKDIEVHYFEVFPEVFDDVLSGSSDFGVCAIENSLAGTINEVYDLLLNKKINIVGEYYLSVKQCLIGQDSQIDLKKIENVYSHPVALSQCSEFLKKNLINAQIHTYHDTAGSVNYVKSLNNPKACAIASAYAASVYGLEVVRPNIQSHKNNSTRFLILGKQPLEQKQPNKTSLTLTTDNTPGSLYKALGVFDKNQLNLTKLQSRSIPGKNWQYLFYVDVESGINNPGLKSALEELVDQGCEINILGSYVAHDRSDSKNKLK
jgi:prephenate dehydratase